MGEGGAWGAVVRVEDVEGRGLALGAAVGLDGEPRVVVGACAKKDRLLQPRSITHTGRRCPILAPSPTSLARMHENPTGSLAYAIATDCLIYM